MSDREIVKILKVQTEGSEQTVKGLREEIKGLQDALLNVEAGTEEYDAVVKKLIDDQTKLNGVMNAGKENGIALEGSYAALQQRLNALQKTWKATNDEGTRNELGKQISEIRGKLSEMDQSTGDWRKNVGNYAQSITQAFGSMGGAASKLVSGPLTSLKAAFTAISAHPIILALVAIVAVIKRLVDAFKTNSEAADTLKQAFSVFQPIIDAVGKAFDWLAGIVAKGIELWAKYETTFLRLIPGYKKAADAAGENAKRLKRIEDEETENVKKNAKDRRQIADLQAKAADKDKYTAKERMAFMQEAFELEEGITQREVDLANERLATAAYELEKHANSDELKRAYAEAEAAVDNAYAALEEKRLSHNKQMSRLRSEDTKDAKDTLLAQLNLEKDFLEQQMGLAEDASDEQLQLAKDKRAKELEIQLAELKDKIKNRKDYEKAELLARKKYEQDILKLETEWAQKRMKIRETVNDIILMDSGSKGSISYQTEQLERAISDLQDMEVAYEGSKKGSNTWQNWGDDNIYQFVKRMKEQRQLVKDYQKELDNAVDKQRLLNQEIERFGVRPEYKKSWMEYSQIMQNALIVRHDLTRKEREASNMQQEIDGFRAQGNELLTEQIRLQEKDEQIKGEIAARQASANTGTQKQRTANQQALKKLNAELSANTEAIELNNAAITDNNSAIEMTTRRMSSAKEEVDALQLAYLGLNKQLSDTFIRSKKLSGEFAGLLGETTEASANFFQWGHRVVEKNGEIIEKERLNLFKAFRPLGGGLEADLKAEIDKYATDFYNYLDYSLTAARSSKDVLQKNLSLYFEDGFDNLVATKALLHSLGLTEDSIATDLKENFANAYKKSLVDGGLDEAVAETTVETDLGKILASAVTFDEFFESAADLYADGLTEALSESFATAAGDLDVGKYLKDNFNTIEAIRDNSDKLMGLVNAGIIPEDVLKQYIELLQNTANKEKEILQQRFQNWSDLAGHINSITESTADMWEESLRKQKEDSEAAGKYDEKKRKQLEDQYKWIQGLRIATATIDTIQGAIAAYMGYQELGQPWGGILGATAAAAVIASGAAEIQKIANTNPYNQASLDSSAAYPTVTPYVPQYTANMTGLQETEQLANALGKTNIWVSVKDINSAQKENEVKVAESRF